MNALAFRFAAEKPEKVLSSRLQSPHFSIRNYLSVMLCVSHFSVSAAALSIIGVQTDSSHRSTSTIIADSVLPYFTYLFKIKYMQRNPGGLRCFNVLAICLEQNFSLCRLALFREAFGGLPGRTGYFFRGSCWTV